MPGIETRLPQTEKIFTAYREPTLNEVLGAMDKAREAAKLWKAVPVGYRVKYLADIRRTITDYLDEIVLHVARTTGKMHTDALMTDVIPLLETLQYYEKNAAALLADRPVKTPFYFRSTTSRISHEPFGVALVISPGINPFRLSMVPLVAAVTAGNAVLLKPSEHTPAAGELADLVCRRAHLPQNLVQVLYGGTETARRIIDAHPDKIAFAGSGPAGRKVMELAARNLIPVDLSLGGKAPMIVFEDAHLERAIEGAVYGAFSNAGQNCVAVERLYVQDAVYEIFLKLLAQRARALRVGNGPEADMGAITSDTRFEIVREHIRDALSRGAKNITEIRENGQFLYPVVLKDANHSMRVMREETFGPVLPVMPFHDEAQALHLANDSPYGLSASVWTNDLEKGKRVAAKIRAGSCCVNDVVRDFSNPGLPFGGVRKSGYGRCHGAHGLYAFSTVKSVTVNTGETAKEINWFPLSHELYESLKTLATLRFSNRPWASRWRGVGRALRFVNKRERLW